MATLSNYISLSTNIPNAMNAAANATTKAYQSMNTLHNKMNGVSSASETLKASMGGIMNSFAGNLLASTVMNGVGAIKVLSNRFKILLQNGHRCKLALNW